MNPLDFLFILFAIVGVFSLLGWYARHTQEIRRYNRKRRESKRRV